MRPLLWIVTLVCSCVLAGCGGGGGSSSSSTPTKPSENGNVASITIDAGPVVNGANTASPNIPFVTVTICVPGSSSCTSIDHVQLDTGSAGLRLVNSQAIAGLGLPTQSASNGGVLAECAQFADGVTWGAVRLADVKIAGETASQISIEVIADNAVPQIPTACTNLASTKQTVAALGANGIIGVGTLANDCGTPCAQQALAVYFGCTSVSNCAQVALPVPTQVPNPVARFSGDNNGTIVQMPGLSATGSPTAQGSLIFGIGTQANNGLGSATVYTTNSSGQFVATYNGTALRTSLLDTGSNGLFFPDTTITACSSTSNAAGFFCPATTTPVSVNIAGDNGTSTTVSLSIANAQTLFTSTSFAFNNLGGPFPGTTFDFGLPFFFGRTVYTAITGASTPGGPGPYVAF